MNAKKRSSLIVHMLYSHTTIATKEEPFEQIQLSTTFTEIMILPIPTESKSHVESTVNRSIGNVGITALHKVYI